MEITANAEQLVTANSNVIFTNTVICGNCSIYHRDNSGLVTLKGSTRQARARYRVFFGGNVAIPSAATITPISLAIALNGEAIATSTMISTPAAVEEYDNVATSIFIDVPACCCQILSVKNLTGASINIENANLIVERVA